MSNITRDGRDWQPAYLLAIDEKKCIGCGRCFKVCGRDVMTLKGLSEDGELSRSTMTKTTRSRRRSW